MFRIIKRILIALPVLVCAIAAGVCSCYADRVNSETTTLKAGISVDQVPVSFYGTWRVAARLAETSSEGTFKPVSADLWNLSRVGNVINLSNPFTGVDASVTVEYLNNNVIRFTKATSYDNKKLTDTVGITLDGDNFTGLNWLTLETYSLRDGRLIRKETATYKLKGERISGASIIEK